MRGPSPQSDGVAVPPWRVAAAAALVLGPVVAVVFTPWRGFAAVVMLTVIGALTAALVDERAVAWTAAVTALVALVSVLVTATGPAVPVLGTALIVLLGLVTSAVTPVGLAGVGVVQILLAAHLLVDPSTLDASLGPSGSTLKASLILAAVVFASGAWVFLVRLAILPGHRETAAAERDLPYGTLLAVLCGLFTLICLIWFKNTNMWWTVMTIALVLQPAARGTRTRATERVIGTFVGGTAVALAVAVIPATTVILVLAIAASVACVVLTVAGAAYWLYATALTVAVMLLSFNPSGMLAGDIQRILCTGVAAVVTVVAVLIVQGLRNRFAAPR